LAIWSIATGCSVERYLSADRPLYGSSRVEIQNPEKVPDPDALEATLLTQVQQEPTSNLAMWWWYKLETEKEKGIKNFFRETLGAPPAHYDQAAQDRTQLLMVDYLKDHGYFGSKLDSRLNKEDSLRVEVVYSLTSQGRARMDTVVWPQDSTAFTNFLHELKPGTFARQGEYYSVAALNAERTRIDQKAANNGFFEFATNNIFYIVDSTAGDNGANVYMKLDVGNDSLTFERFHIGDTYIFPNWSVGEDYSAAEVDTVVYDDLHVVRHSAARIHPPVLERRIGLRRGDMYDEHIYRNTVNQLLDLGVFKYVNYEFKRRLTDTTPVLDQFIYLTQGKSQRVGADFEATNRAGSTAPGLSASVNYGNNNLLSGAEDFRTELSYAVGTQTDLTDFDETVVATDLAVRFELALPRLISPFAKALEREAFYIPRTLASTRYQLTSRPEFNLQSITLRLGYRYQASPRVTHELYPINLSYTGVTNASPTFDSLIKATPRFGQALQSNAIAGLEYIYRYNDQPLSGVGSYWTFEGGFKTSGNVASLFATTPDDGGPKTLGGVILSQYARAYLDARRTVNLSRTTALASRAYIGAALPYGNSLVVPYIDQFFAGGPNSIRAFRLRGVGPGKALPPGDSLSTNSPLNQSGDIRLELNAEYRFDVAPFVEGAVFTDIGNVWLARPIGAESPEGLFRFEDFYKELAVGLGAGIRLDFDILIVRFDVPAPIRRPWITGGDAWTLSNFNIFNSETRSRVDGPRFHIAIGYPF